MSVLLGSEWCHNLAHAYAAYTTGKPMDKIKILWGMPRCVYEDINDPSVTPRQHVHRSLGGPIFNFITLLAATIARFFTRPSSISREVANVAVGTNAFLSTVSFLPIPGIDGGPILKWSLVKRGYEVDEADEQVRVVNGLLSLIMASVSGIAFRKEKRFIGILSLLLSIVSFGVFARWIQEERLPF
jgi:Zn-dependent protease